MDIVTAQEMYEWDRVTIEDVGIDGAILMDSAGRAVADDMASHIEKRDKIVVLIGAGNNGGDGFVIARTLLNRGYDVEAWQVVPDEKIKGDAAKHRSLFLASGYELHSCKEVGEVKPSLEKADVIIDAMLGIGVRGGLREPIADIVQEANAQKARRMSVDLPTGVPADETDEQITAFHADKTTIVAAPKMSAFLEKTSSYYGKWNVVEIGLPSPKLPDPRRQVWTEADVKRTLPRRDRNAHKGSHGKGLIVGGSTVMPGSVAMSARASLRSGAGLITIATVESAIPSIAPFIQEATFVGLGEKEGFACRPAPSSLSDYDGIAFGMGIGRQEPTRSLLSEILQEADTPLLIDADGLYELPLDLMQKREAPTILTPHPGEFAQLTGKSISDVLARPFSLSRTFAQAYGVHLVLKGPSTIITSPDGEQRVDVSGNAGLAKGGSGDVLSGMLVAMIMQHDSMMDALANGCVLHGKTAERLTSDDHSMIDLLASDVVEGLPITFRAFS
ncbi:NAD(P)H-hydrate dehydratase [Halobacillus locisalis]|uniref:Bifunctional NAD(P)H-hydrate repair enzyme n=1 Tax=Halobacillus locisalis TaxID=220753 RepID=A0A838CXY2_9BACI|nr:NAD(P)H-hydrate dehydratase [Halobacillus locisalis]MBA2176793.1 NAD(P)H-hydrate dehydratase [Halobacillus locisalis]